MLLWWSTFLVAGLLVHGALRNADSTALSAGLLAGAVVLPLTMLAYTLRTNGDDFNSQILIPAIGPVVIAVLIFDYVEYNQRIDEAFSAQLISADLVQLLDVKWAGASAGTSGYLSGEVSNRSPHQLTGMSLDVALYAGGEKIASMTTDADLDVPPGQQREFKVNTIARPAGPSEPLACTDERAGSGPAPAIRGSPQKFECIYRLERTRGEEVFF